MLFSRRSFVIINSVSITLLSGLFLATAVLAHNKVVVIPLGGDIAPTSKKIFYTDETSNGNLGGVSGADAMCQASAATAGVSGQFKAWIGVGSGLNIVPGRPNFKYYDLPYNNVDGSPVAFGFVDFLDGIFLGNIKSGSAIDSSGAPVWTGLNNDGAFIGGCFDWTEEHPALRGVVGATGFSHTDFVGWSQQSVVDCDTLAHLYCFEQ